MKYSLGPASFCARWLGLAVPALALFNVAELEAEDQTVRNWLSHVRNMETHLLQDVPLEVLPSNDKYTFETKWFAQSADHVNKQNRERFWQRYFVYADYSKHEHNFPLFVYCGGEQGDIYREWERLGFMLEVAKRQGAKVLFLEHRYFGSSLPFGNQSFLKHPSRVGLLSLEQSFQDYAEIIRQHKGDGPVITYGGSLSGTIAALIRIQFPSLIDMAFASSAPLLGFDGVADQFAWRQRLTANFAELGGADCPQLVRDGFTSFYQKDVERLRDAFQICESESVTDEQWQFLMYHAWGHVEMLGNFVYPANKSHLPGSCARMRASPTKEHIFADLLNMSKKHGQGRPCTNVTQMQESSWAGSQMGVGLGWSYMACTEVVHPIGANNKTDMFPPFNWTVGGLAQSCQHSWNVHPDAGYLGKKTGLFVTGMGADAKIKRTDAVPGRILFSWGTKDPWGTMVPKQGWRDDVTVIRVPGGAHCSDLETPRKEDTEDMERARHQIEAQLVSWINELRPLRAQKLRGFGASNGTASLSSHAWRSKPIGRH